MPPKNGMPSIPIPPYGPWLKIIDRKSYWMVHNVLCQVIQKISKKHWWFQWFPSKCTCCRYSICLSVYLSVYLSISLSLSIHTSIHPSIYRSMQKKTNPKSSKKKSRVCWPSTLPRHLPSSFQLRCSPQGVHTDPMRATVSDREMGCGQINN